MKLYKGLLLLISIFLLIGRTSWGQPPCPDFSERRVASSFHSTLMIDHEGKVLVWGDGAMWNWTSGNTFILTPSELPASSFLGTPRAVAAGSVGGGSATTFTHQMFLLTTQALYGWGQNNGGTINHNDVTSSSYASIRTLTLPQITIGGMSQAMQASDIAFIEASGGGIAIVTKLSSENSGRTNGEVYIRNGGNAAFGSELGGGGSKWIYGDGQSANMTTMDAVWHQVRINTSTPLTNVARLSYAPKALMALTINNEVYVWGERVRLGNNIPAGTYGNYNYATLVNLPAGISAITDININTRSSWQTGTGTGQNPNPDRCAVMFILAGGKLYGLGDGIKGVLGQGNETTQNNWVIVKGPSGGTTELDNIVQISSNNAWTYAQNNSTTHQYCAIGALRSDGQLFLWGENSRGMLGRPNSSNTFYSLPTVPPNFSVNNAKVGYFHMGGHTTIAFLQGSNRFCYIGHLVRGSMGNGINGDSDRESFDCINTPDAHLCTPPPPIGCADPSANDLIASANSAVLVINGQPSVTFWGEASSSAEPGVNVSVSKILYEYNGVPRGVAASSVGTSGTENTQMWILTDQGIWGWGFSANTVNSQVNGDAGMTQLSVLPAGVTAADINFIRSARGGLAIVTNTGEVWIKAGTNSACHPAVYGDNTTGNTLNTSWHQVLVAANTPLTGVRELSFAGTAAMAITSANRVYVWGNNVYRGNNAASARTNMAADITANLHADFGQNMQPKSPEIVQAGSAGAAQFLLGTNGVIYVLGSGQNGALGLGNTNAVLAWNKITGIPLVKKIRTNNSFAGTSSAPQYTVAALTSTGRLYTWGSPHNGILGNGTTSGDVTTPAARTFPAGVTSVSNFQMGGYHIIAFADGAQEFFYTGRYNGGAMANGSEAPGNNTTFTKSAAQVPNCAGAVYTLGGNLYHDTNGLTDGLVNGNGISQPAGVQMYANLLDNLGYVIATAAIQPNGSYTFTGAYPSGNYVVQVSSVQGTLFEPAPATNIPGGWQFTGAQLGTVAHTGIHSLQNGTLPVNLSANMNNINFGIQRPPATANNTLPDRGNPGGTNPVVITNAFLPGDPDGSISSITITGFPSDVTSLRVNDTTYYANAGAIPAVCPTGVCMVFPAATGVEIPTGPSGTPVVPVSVDPVDGNVTPVVRYTAKDNAGASSGTPSAVNIPLQVISVSGKIWHDTDGSRTKNGTETNVSGLPGSSTGGSTMTGSAQYANLIDPDGNVIASVAVDAAGNYTFSQVPANTSGLQIQISATAGAVSEPKPATVFPAGWVNTGVYVGPGNAAIQSNTANIIDLNTANAAITDQDFGMQQPPVTSGSAYGLASQPQGRDIIWLNGTVPASSGPHPAVSPVVYNDPDGPANSLTLVITALPYVGALETGSPVLLYDGTLVDATNFPGLEIPGFDPSRLALKLNGPGNYTSVSFDFRVKDAAGALSNTSVYNLFWNQPLPVTLISFEAYGKQEHAVLAWSTASEENSKEFIIERSGDAREWDVTGMVPSKSDNGWSTVRLDYGYTDMSPLSGHNYYRLRQMDLDGKYTYSPVRMVWFGKPGVIAIYPNPAGRSITISNLEGNEHILIYDAAGKAVHSFKATAASESVNLEGLVPGAYQITIQTPDNHISRFKLVKTH